MPVGGKNRAGVGEVFPGPALIAIILLTGCMGSDMSSMLRTGEDVAPSMVAGGSLAPQTEVQSSLIADLQARRSVLPPSGAFAKVADAVVAASAGAAAAELRVARLKAESRAKNWLPSIGPSVNLTSLSGLAASLLVETALFDNGRRKAEREFVAADVEVAAVGLSSSINQRVFEGLTYYLNAQRARAQASISSNAAGRLQEFETIMGMRVEGGISDRSEQRVISQRYAEMQATMAADQQTEATAMAELAALAGGPLPGITGLDSLQKSTGIEPLSVLRARGEGTRAIAQSKLERAGMMPGLSATANVGADGVNPGVRMTGAGLLNPGSGAALEALAQTADVVDRQTAEASETANRRIVALERQIATLASRQAQGTEVLRQTEGNLELFTQQYKVGRRTLLELVGQYDSFARLERDQVSLRYDIAVLELEIARDRGLLVDGARM
jgi:adhesin transport system outer membrane protein